MKTVTLVDGSITAIVDAPNAIGILTRNNDVPTVAEADGFLYLVTQCCGASATGSFALDDAGNEIPAICCRNCYRVVPDYYGAPVAPEQVLRIKEKI